MHLIINMAGGLGLILLGMKLMTDGLKLAGGGMLRRVLATWTRTPLRGLAAGFGMTAMVQSSSAVTVAAIGFVNAGLLSMSNTTWVVYGSNIGTTTTAWIVAFLGLKIKVKLLALPFIAMGTGLWIAGKVSRRAAVGEALAGFGLFFLGIEILQGAFSGLEQQVAFQEMVAPGVLGQLAFVGVGFILTFLMQSSSASMALILTATAGGMVPLDMAAAGAIGANVGTTSTAALSVIGATANAKRVAAMHVIFNIITGLAALGILNLLLGLIMQARMALGMDLAVVSVLAIFHTCFNVLGVLIMWPFTSRLVAFLKNRFRTEEEDESRPRYIDDSVLSTPAIALGAMVKEVTRIGLASQRMVFTALKCSNRPCRELHRDKAILDKLQSQVGTFSAKLRKHGLSHNASEAMPLVLRASRYFVLAGESALEADKIIEDLDPLEDMDLKEQWGKLMERAVQLSLNSDAADANYNTKMLDEKVRLFEQGYQTLKAALLEAGALGEIPIGSMVGHLDYLSAVHRMMDQTAKGALMLSGVGQDMEVFEKQEGRERGDE